MSGCALFFTLTGFYLLGCVSGALWRSALNAYTCDDEEQKQ